MDNELLIEIRDLLARLVELAEPQPPLVVHSSTKLDMRALHDSQRAARPERV